MELMEIWDSSQLYLVNAHEFKGNLLVSQIISVKSDNPFKKTRVGWFLLCQI